MIFPRASGGSFSVSRRPDIGVKDLVLGALPGNTDAIRLYERRGYRPTWLYLSRLEGRN